MMTNYSGVGGSSTDGAQFPYWIAPELRTLYYIGYCCYKADIWSFGICALELAHGRPPIQCESLSPLLTNRLRFEKIEFNDPRKVYTFSESFKDMVESCLEPDPIKRPTCEKLLKHPFFGCCEGMEMAVLSMLSGLPSIDKGIRKRYNSKFNLDHRSRLLQHFDEDEESENGISIKEDPWIEKLLKRRGIGQGDVRGGYHTPSGSGQNEVDHQM